MSSQKTRPIYGASKGAKSGELSSGLNPKANSTYPKQEYAKSCDLSGRLNPDRGSRIAKSAALQSLPRTLFRFSIVGIICCLGVKHTQMGKNLTTLVALKISESQLDAKKAISTINPQERGKRRQKQIDNRFKESWKNAGGKPE